MEWSKCPWVEIGNNLKENYRAGKFVAKSLRIPDEQPPFSWHGCVEERLQRALLPIQSVSSRVSVVPGI